MQPIFFSGELLQELLPFSALVPKMLAALSELTLKQASHSPRHVMNVPGGAFGMMAGAGSDYIGAKMVCVLPGNSARALNPHQGVVALFDPSSGKCIALGCASTITALRTAATSAAATHALARTDSSVLTIVGSGLQAELHARAIQNVREIRELRVVARSEENAKALAKKFNREDLRVITNLSLEEALEDTDVLCLCTAAEEPYLSCSELPEGIHVNAVGACRPGHRELIMRATRTVFVESLCAAREEAEELLPAFSQSKTEKIVEIGNVFTGQHLGRTLNQEITIFKSVGIGLEDAAALHLAYSLNAEKENHDGINQLPIH